MKKFYYVVLLGFSIVAVGAVLVLVTSNQSVPPVDVNLDQSGLTSVGGVYFDQIFLHNHGPENVTVVVLIKNDLDNGPRMSDPVQICPGCSATALVEEHTPPQDPDQADVFTNIVLHPDYIRVEYLSVILDTPITFDVLREIGWMLVAAGFVVVACGLRLTKTGKLKRTKNLRRQKR